MKRNGIILLSLLAVLIFAGWFAGLIAFNHDTAKLTPPTPAQKLDAIVVLTGGSNRMDTGFDLLEHGFGKKLFISGVYRGLDVKQLLKRWKAEPQSNLDCCVVLGFTADNTAGNAVETIEWLQKEGFHSLYLVTANYHMRRALLEFRRLAPELDITPFPVVPDKTDTTLIMKEYTKFLAAYVRNLV